MNGWGLHPSFFTTTDSRESLVNLCHDYPSPLNACGDQFVTPWTALRTSKEVVSRLHVQARQNRSHDSDDPFPALVHRIMVA